MTDDTPTLSPLASTLPDPDPAIADPGDDAPEFDPTDLTPEVRVHVVGAGPVRVFDHVFVPGVNVLVAENGAGKSELQRAVGQALGVVGGRMNVTDGMSKADAGVWVDEGDGKGPKRKLWGSSAAQGDDIGIQAAPSSPMRRFLTGDGLTDTRLADARRVTALCDMLPSMASVADEDLTFLSDAVDADFSDRPAGLNVVGAVDWLRGCLNTEALADEKAAQEATAGERAAQDQIDRLGIQPTRPAEYEGVPTPVATFQRLSDAQRKAAVTRANVDRRKGLEASRATLGDRPEVDEYVAAYTGMRTDYDAQRVVVDRLQQELADAQARLADGQARLAELKREGEHAAAAKSEAEQAQVRYDTTMKTFDAIATLPTDADMEDANSELLAAEMAHELAMRANAFDTENSRADKERDAAREKRDAAALLAKAKAKRAKALRAAKDGLKERLGELLAQRGVPGGLDIEDGRLYATDPFTGDRVLFANPGGRQLSQGQQARVLLEVVAAAYGGNYIDLDPDWWAALDPATKADVGAMCAARNIIAVTSRPDDGDGIRVEVVS